MIKKLLRWATLGLLAISMTACAGGSSGVMSQINAKVVKSDTRFKPSIVKKHNINKKVQDAIARTVQIGIFEIDIESDVAKLVGLGTGIILDNKGSILTAAHVADKVAEEGKKVLYMAKLNTGEKVTCDVVAIGKGDLDLALLKASALANRNFSQIQIKDMLPVYKKPQRAFAVGGPQHKTFPYVSYGTVHKSVGIYTLHKVYIDHGSSGGPLLDLDGNLVGINVSGHGVFIPGEETILFEGRAIRGKAIIDFLKRLAGRVVDD